MEPLNPHNVFKHITREGVWPDQIAPLLGCTTTELIAPLNRLLETREVAYDERHKGYYLPDPPPAEVKRGVEEEELLALIDATEGKGLDRDDLLASWCTGKLSEVLTRCHLGELLGGLQRDETITCQKGRFFRWGDRALSPIGALDVRALPDGLMEVLQADERTAVVAEWIAQGKFLISDVDDAVKVGPEVDDVLEAVCKRVLVVLEAKPLTTSQCTQQAYGGSSPRREYVTSALSLLQTQGLIVKAGNKWQIMVEES